jgi:hypothetical protein
VKPDPSALALRAEELAAHEQELGGWTVRVSSFRLGDRWYASVESLDAGARIARGEAATRAEAEGIALEKAAQRLAKTRTFPA